MRYWWYTVYQAEDIHPVSVRIVDRLQSLDFLLLSNYATPTTISSPTVCAVLTSPYPLHDFTKKSDTPSVRYDSSMGVVVGSV